MRSIRNRMINDIHKIGFDNNQELELNLLMAIKENGMELMNVEVFIQQKGMIKIAAESIIKPNKVQYLDSYLSFEINQLQYLEGNLAFAILQLQYLEGNLAFEVLFFICCNKNILMYDNQSILNNSVFQLIKRKRTFRSNELIN